MGTDAISDTNQPLTITNSMFVWRRKLEHKALVASPITTGSQRTPRGQASPPHTRLSANSLKDRRNFTRERFCRPAPEPHGLPRLLTPRFSTPGSGSPSTQPGSPSTRGFRAQRRPRTTAQGHPSPIPSLSLLSESGSEPGRTRNSPGTLDSLPTHPPSRTPHPHPAPQPLTCCNMAALRQPHFREPRQRGSRRAGTGNDAAWSPKARKSQSTSLSSSPLPLPGALREEQVPTREPEGRDPGHSERVGGATAGRISRGGPASAWSGVPGGRTGGARRWAGRPGGGAGCKDWGGVWSKQERNTRWERSPVLHMALGCKLCALSRGDIVAT